MVGRNYCSIPGCRSNRKKLKTEGQNIAISLFTPPNNVELFEKWQKAMPSSELVLTRKDRICELHFNEDDIERFYVTILNDGTVHKIERPRARLKHEAIPCKFNDISLKEEKRKCPKENLPLQIVESNAPKDTNIVEKEQNFEEIVTDEHAICFDPVATFTDLLNKITNVLIPKDLWGVTATANFIIFSRWTTEYNLIKKVVIESDLNVKIFLQEKEVNITDSRKISSLSEITALLNTIENISICKGVTDKLMTKCSIILNKTNKAGPQKIWCSNCVKMRRKNEKSKTGVKTTVLGFKTLQSRLKNVKKINKRLKIKTEQLRQKIFSCQKQCSSSKKEVVEEAINLLPLAQKEAVRACFEAAKLKNLKNSRYSLNWIYECLLIRIKSTKAYEHLRRNKIMALPSPQTLHKYIEKVKGIYGFQPSVFNCLKKKSENMDVKDRRGILLLDEMKISPKVNFNRKTLKIEGFTDLGNATPSDGKKGDHALVFMYQPFRGKWVQSLACFLSKNAASGYVLHHLIMECIILLEKSGFYVDGVTCDGATWNRKMWLQFGIDSTNTSCNHICDEKRRLWFFSDFPHLIKNVRNMITEKRTVKTPDGIVSTKFWEAVITADNPNSFSLKMCPKLKPDHINPKFYQKMNVAMAFQFFSHDVACAMELLKPSIPSLKNSDGCITFIKRMHQLIKVMNSRLPKDALRSNSSSVEVVKSFIQYLHEWENSRKSEEVNFLSESTSTGLKVTLKSTLELLEFLKENEKYEYLMTSRLSQDALERFFSMMRNACGCNDHPDATTFLQVFRLLGTYSLIKPPRGSNTAGSELVRSLLDFNDLTDANNTYQEFSSRLELLLTTGSKTFKVDDYEDHSYFQQNSSDCVVGFLAGFVAFRAQKMTTCIDCKNCLTLNEQNENLNPNSYSLINVKTFGYLKKPSTELINLISIVEKSTMKVVSAQKLQIDTLSEIITDLEQVSNLPLIGCPKHDQTFTKALLNYYLIIRMNFLCKRENIIDDIKTNKSRQYRKLSRL